MAFVDGELVRSETACNTECIRIRGASLEGLQYSVTVHSNTEQ